MEKLPPVPLAEKLDELIRLQRETNEILTSLGGKLEDVAAMVMMYGRNDD